MITEYIGFIKAVQFQIERFLTFRSHTKLFYFRQSEEEYLVKDS